MPKPTTNPGKAKDKAPKVVLQKGKNLTVTVNIPADELSQYGPAEIDALAAKIQELGDALAVAKETEEEDDLDD